MKKNPLALAASLAILLGLPMAALAGNIKVLKRGLGEGSVAVTGTTPPAIDCGIRCDGAYTDGTPLTFTATFDAAEYRFVGWEGAVTGTTNPITRTLTGDVAVSAIFQLRTPFPVIPDFSPEGTVPMVVGGIKRYLLDNLNVNTAARFLSALPDEYRHNWLLMTRSESLQSGTAKYPRLILPGRDARFVFTIGLTPHGAYPGSHPLAIEYMQWDAAQKNFRFHEIVLNRIEDMGPYAAPATFPARDRGIVVDDRKCFKCHSTRNILNTTASLGTNGIPPGSVQTKNKPNWEAYDSWGGMMPFNRDRIYQGSLEDRAFRSLFNLWNWRNSALNDAIRQVIEQLHLQPTWVTTTSPHYISRNANATLDNAHIAMGYDGRPALTTPPHTYPPTARNTTYAFGEPASAGPAINQGGRYITLRHTNPRIPASNDDYNNPDSDEGRAVRFFDALGGLVSLDVDGIPGDDGNFNAQRVADELINHAFATGSHPIDVRPAILAICDNLLTINGNRVESSDEGARPLSINRAFFDDRNGMTVDLLETNTRDRTKTIPNRKLVIEKYNLDRRLDTYVRWRLPGTLALADGMFQEYAGTAAPTLSQLRQEAFYRPRETFRASTEINGDVFVDREDYSPNTRQVTLFRYLLEPLGVSVDKWSMGVRGRSRAYAFADVFSAYISTFERVVIASIASRPVRNRRTGAVVPMAATPTSAEIITALNATLEGIETIDPMPKYTDIQRIFNKSCIECHGGLEYPPYSNYTNNMPGPLDFSEDETPGAERLLRAYEKAIDYTTDDLTASNAIYSRITQNNESATRDAPTSGSRLMPFGGPSLSKTDIETIKRWVLGPPNRPRTYGDPHLRTVNGIDYDFQAAGEYTLLRGDFFEVQARHTAVQTNGPCGPNPHTGLTTCVSVNTAVAVKIGAHRITYQPNLSGVPDTSGLQLRIDGELVTMTPDGIPFARGSRIIPTIAPGGIRIEAPGGTAVVITPGFWDHYRIWYLNLDIPMARASEGLMGIIPPGNWLPALPNGVLLGEKPKDLASVYKRLYGVFGPAWQVKDSTSLFDYAPGTSTATYSLPAWPGGEMPQICNPPAQPSIPPQPPIARNDAERLCTEIGDAALRIHCIEDIMATGEVGFAKTYRYTDRISRNKKPAATVLLGPADFAEELTLPIDFKWNSTTDPDGDTIRYKLYVWPVHEAPNHNDAVPIPTDDQTGQDKLKCVLLVLLIGLAIWLIFFFLWRKKRPKLLVGLALLVILAAVLAYFLCARGAAPTGPLSKTVTDLQPGRDYFWRVIAEDGKGGTVQSETRRFGLK